MIPDLETVLRRRHVVVILIRAAVLLMLVWWAISVLDEIVYGVLTLNLSSATWNFLPRLASGIVWLGVAGALLLFQRRLAALLVPMGRRIDSCMHCGYALKDLRSDLCPECGTPTHLARTVPPAPHPQPSRPPAPPAAGPVPPPPPGFPRS